MKCKSCKYRVQDTDSECGHPDALEIWARYDGEKCPIEVENEQANKPDRANLRADRESLNCGRAGAQPRNGGKHPPGRLS